MIIIVLELDKKSNAQVLLDGGYYVVCLTDNPNYSAADIIALLLLIKSALTTMLNACNAAVSETKQSDIDIARDTVERYLKMMAGKVEGVVNAPGLTDEQRIQKLDSSGMHSKNHPHTQRHKFTVKCTALGKVHLTAQGMANAHEWQYTKDVLNFTNRIPAKSTTTSYTDIEGLENKKEYAFFHKAIIAKQDTDWEAPIIEFVK